MRMVLIESNRHTKIVVTLKSYPAYKTYINTLIALYGGKEIKRNSRYVHIEIFEDLLNKKRREE